MTDGLVVTLTLTVDQKKFLRSLKPCPIRVKIHHFIHCRRTCGEKQQQDRTSSGAGGIKIVNLSVIQFRREGNV